jgi:hypothetical protein
VTLAEADVERWSRQILLPEVGGRGQARLLASRVAVTGSGPAAETAAILVERAGPAVVGAGAAADLRIALVDDGAPLAGDAPLVAGILSASRLVVATLVGRPCAACLPAGAIPPSPAPSSLPPALAAPAALLAGALVATEALRVLLDAPTAGRLHVLDLAGGAPEVTAVRPSPGCPRCEAAG